jgi:hypothetical protein
MVACDVRSPPRILPASGARRACVANEVGRVTQVSISLGYVLNLQDEGARASAVEEAGVPGAAEPIALVSNLEWEPSYASSYAPSPAAGRASYWADCGPTHLSVLALQRRPRREPPIRPARSAERSHDHFADLRA